MSQTQQRSRDGLQCSNVIFYGLDTIVGVLVIVDSVLLLTVVNSFVGFFLPIYFLVFGLIILLFVFYAPPQLYASLFFYSYFIGRGLTFLFIGSVILVFGDDFSLATGIITIIVAFVYLIFSIWTKFCKLGCFLPPPVAQRQTGVITSNDSTKPSPINKANNTQQTPPANSNQKTAPNDTNVTVNMNDPQQYGSAYEDEKPPQYSAIEAKNAGPQLSDQNGKDLNSEIMAAFGQDLSSVNKQNVPGYKSEIPTVLVMLEQRLHDTGGYKKRGIFDPDTISSNKDNDESYLISNNIIAYFSEMPDPLLSFIDKKVFDKGVNKDAMWRVLEQIDVEYGAVLQFVWDMLAKVAKFESNTGMTSEQLGRIFGPLMTMSKRDMNNDMLTASKMIVCWRRGIDWRM
eukprot:948040_1